MATDLGQFLGGGGYGLENVTNLQSGQAMGTQFSSGIAGGTAILCGTTTTNAWTTVLSVSASGYLMSLTWKHYENGGSTDNRIRLTIDGTQIMNMRATGATFAGYIEQRMWPQFYEVNTQVGLTYQQVQNTVSPIRFESSLLVEVYKNFIFENSAKVGYVLAS